MILVFKVKRLIITKTKVEAEDEEKMKFYFFLQSSFSFLCFLCWFNN